MTLNLEMLRQKGESPGGDDGGDCAEGAGGVWDCDKYE